MDKLEKVLKGLACCTNGRNTVPHCEDCPYNGFDNVCAKLDEMHKEALELLKEQEIKPYGGFIEFPDAAGELTGYAAIVEHMMKAGILKVVKQEAPMLTRYNWAIKAVKWEWD